jgi:hypothetical protein
MNGTTYEIRLGGLLDEHWSTWFDGLTLTHRDGTTVISGPVADQAELHGLLARIRDLGVPLLSVRATGADDEVTDCPHAQHPADRRTRPQS